MGFLTDSEIAELVPSEFAPHSTPISTEIVSSHEYTLPPQAGPARSNLRYGYASGTVDWSAFA